MNRKRLQDVIRVLDKAEAAGGILNMPRWRVDADDCGTSACAVGWAAMDPWHKAQGLFLAETRKIGAKQLFVIRYGDAKGFDAVDDYFEIERSMTLHLFDPLEYPTTDITYDMVRNRIKEALEAPL